MRVLLVNDYSTPYGGAEIITLGLRDGLRARGHQARLFASRARYAGGPYLADADCAGASGRLQTLGQTTNLDAYRRLRQELATFRPDVVHVTMFLWQLSPLILPLLRAVPSMYYAVTYKAVCPRGTKQLPSGLGCRARPGLACWRHGCLTLPGWPPLVLQQRLWRRWRRAFDRILATSAAVRERLEAEGIAPVEVVYPGVRATPARPPLREPPTAAFLGRLVPEKGADVLLQAFAWVTRRLPAARLLLSGAGSERARLERLVETLGLTATVSFLGPLAHEAADRALSAAWVQVVPSVWPEPFGIVAAEALMRGTAVVASATGGLPEIVAHGQTGLLVPPGDVAALADGLLELLGDRARAEQLGAAGRQSALAQYDEDDFVERMLAVYRGLAASRGATHVR